MDRTNGTHHFSKQTLVGRVCRRGASLPVLAHMIAAVFALFVTASATAAVIEINGSQIQTAGELNATVDYTSEKLSINIPGVTIILDCGAQVPAESCTLTTGTSGTEQTALTPTFGSPSPVDGGFTVQVSNYDGAYSWSATSSTGTANINGAGLVSVSGLTSGQSATVTVTATRSGYATGSAAVSGTAKTADPNLGTALVPLLALPTSTADGFTVQVTNFSNTYDWSVSANVGSATISDTGLVTVTGLSAGQSATIRVTTTRSGYEDGASEKTGSAQTVPEECKPGMDCYDTCAPENRPASNESGAQDDWDLACADYDPNENPVNPGPEECKPGMDCYDTCAPENRPASNESGAQDDWDLACADYDPTTDQGPTEEECPGEGYDCYVPPPVAGSDGEGAEEVVAVSFPIDSARVVKRAGDENGDFDFGTAGRNGGSGRVYWSVEQGVVSAAGLTLADDDVTKAVRISFGVTADQPSAALHYWISNEPDGDTIQDCNYVGYAQTSQRFSIVGLDDGEDCQLERGEKYFVNLAFCDSEDGDIECRSAQATAAESEAAAVLAVRSSLID